MALVQVDAAGVIVGANPVCERILRRPPAQLVGRMADDPLWAVADFAGRPIAQADLPHRRALCGQHVSDMAVSVAGPGGERLYYKVNASPLRRPDGRVDGAVLAFFDFGEEREDLAKIRARKAFALDSARTIVWEWDPETGSFEHSPDPSVPGRTLPRSDLLNMVHPDDRERIRQLFDNAFQNDEEYNSEFRIAVGGEERWAMARGRVVRGEGGKPLMSGVMIDITESKRLELARSAAQEALALSEKRFRLAVDATGAGMYDIDLKTGESIWTPKTFEMFGYPYAPGGRATAGMIIHAMHPDDIPRLREAEAQAERAREPLAFEYRIRHRQTHEERWLRAYGRIFQIDGSPRALGIVFDITDLKRAEERERLLMREVDHRAKNVMALVQSVMHLTPHDDVDAFVESITGRIAAIARVHTLLAEDRGAPSVKKLIESELAPFHRAAQIEIEGDDASAPPAAAQAFAMVVHELSSNAAKYGALAAPEGRLTVRTRWEGSNFTIEWIEKAPWSSRAPRQAGFGAQLIKILVEDQIGGQVSSEWLESGLSTRISLTGLGSAARDRVAGQPERAGEMSHDLRGRSILVVEDDALIAMSLAASLRDAGAHVRIFNTVEEALSSVRSAPPEFAVLDVNVRGVPVTPVAAELSQRHVPIVYATGYSDNLADLPPGAILRKPCAPADVVDLLQRVVAA